MNLQYINPLLEATINVLTTMAMVEVDRGKPSIKVGSKPLGDITGMIALTGVKTQGSLAISFSKAAILDITEKMLGEKIDSIDNDIVDLVGEVTNMITGDAKRTYSEQGIEFDLTIPSVQVGREQDLLHSVAGKPIVVPLSIAAGDFYIEFCFN